ncbi:MAG: hypothetical protein H0W53_01660 [Acidobacteria bacterium]|nr:hypothetical protein [Acidobacteriota bacterium]
MTARNVAALASRASARRSEEVQRARRSRGGLWRSLASLALLGLTAGCTSFYEVPIETPIQAKLDVGAFRRVLVAGFISGGTEDVDANMETVRLLRSQLRTKTNLRVIEAEVLPLVQLAGKQGQSASTPADAIPSVGDLGATTASPSGQAPAIPPARAATVEEKAKADAIRTRKDLERYERIFADAAFWKKLGEEYESPLIITGTIMFTPQQTSRYETENRETYDQLGRRVVVPIRTFRERKGFVLEPKFVFIDGRTGATLYSETQRREVLYPLSQNTPALASYFELMDQLIPDFLGALSTQKIRGSRILLR